MYLATDTERAMCKKVYQAMDACNLSGLLIFWANEVNPVVNEACKNGTDERNQHPFHLMMVDKLAQLAGARDANISDAYWEVSKLAKLEGDHAAN